MRISVKDPGVIEKLRNRPDGQKSIRVYLDDVEQRLCIAADEDEGQVTRFVTDSRGNIVADNGSFAVETVRGVVRIVLPDWWVS